MKAPPLPDASWFPYEPETDFPIQHLPFGVFRDKQGRGRLASAIGDRLIDLSALAELGLFAGLGLEKGLFLQESLNPLLETGLGRCRQLRERVAHLLDSRNEASPARERAHHFLLPRHGADMLLPVQVGDYTDFYASREHAEAVGALFRDPDNPLLPNWLHLPVAYHGRASSIVVSGRSIRRPQGQFLPLGAKRPVFGPTRELDFELELAFIVGRNTRLGTPVSVAEAADHVFGFVLLNDWSARDIQRWEYKPLGPFLGKNFASTISPWVVPLDALHPFQVDGPAQHHPTPLPYLHDPQPRALDIDLEVHLKTPQGTSSCLSRTNARFLYWSFRQQLAHHTVNGCNLRVGDLLASGTISGPRTKSAGSLLELTEGGKTPVELKDGGHRLFLEDGDEVSLRAAASGSDYRIGFGEATGYITPAGIETDGEAPRHS